MIKEDKQLALQDLCARLPYGVIGEYSWKGNEPYNRELTGSLFDELKSSWDSTEDSEFLPYLRPLSSMTEEENLGLAEFVGVHVSAKHGEIYFPNLSDNTACNWHKVFDWLNKKMFDYRGLIPRSRAIEVTKEELDNLRRQLN